MLKKQLIKRTVALVTSLVLTVSLGFNGNIMTQKVVADTIPTDNLGSGSIGIGSNDSQVAKLPTLANQDTYRFTTENYNQGHPALDTTDWATNWLWSTGGDRKNHNLGALSGSAYALPLAYLMKTDGLRITKPSMTSNKTNISAYTIMDNDTLADFKLSPDWTCDSSYIDDSTDWTYTAVASNPNDRNQIFKTTMTQGSPFGYFELSGSNTVYLEKLRASFASRIVFEENYNGAKMWKAL